MINRFMRWALFSIRVPTRTTRSGSPSPAIGRSAAPAVMALSGVRRSWLRRSSRSFVPSGRVSCGSMTIWEVDGDSQAGQTLANRGTSATCILEGANATHVGVEPFSARGMGGKVIGRQVQALMDLLEIALLRKQ